MRIRSPELQYLQTLCCRVDLNEEEQYQLSNLEQGYNGEQQLDQVMSCLSVQPSLQMDDITISYKDQVVQIDKLFSIGQTIYLVDAKCYRGTYSFQAGSWYHDQKILTHNIFSQIDRARDILARILEDNQVSMPIKTLIVFINPNSRILLDDSAVNTVKKLGEFADFVEEVIVNDRSNYSFNWRPTIRKYTIPSYKPKQDYSSHTKGSMKTGICCYHCHKFNLEQKRSSFYCKSCGQIEAKEQAYVRTICDYGVIFFKQKLKPRNLATFFGPAYSKRYICMMLKKHFRPALGNAKTHGYENKGLQFRYWFADKTEFFRKIRVREQWK